MSDLFAVIEVFDWTSEDGATHIHFRITEALLAIAQGTLHADAVETPTDEAFAREWLVQRGLNYRYCMTMSASRLAEPVLGVWMPDGTVLLIDGSHRYFARVLRKLPLVRYRIVGWGDIAPYMTLTGAALRPVP
jgi:hypothetical protein